MSRRASLKKRQRKEYTGSAESVAGLPTAAPGQQAEILNLQRSAGNRAVEQLLQPNADGKPHVVENVPPGVESALNGSSGQPLDAATRDAMESVLGQDLANVRVHTDAQAAESAEAVNALAYTAGQDIVFGSGRYAPETSEGRELLQHELAHTVQQRDANASGETTRILRAPNPAKSDPPSLFASTIPAPTVMRVGSSILATVYFGQNNFLMDSANLAAVDKLADELRFLVNPSVMVDGYASSEGTAEYNRKLSELRRQTVIALLSAKSIGAAIMSGAAHGESDAAITETATDAKELESQRALNRRVTIFIMSSAAKASTPEEKKSPPKLFDLPSTIVDKPAVPPSASAASKEGGPKVETSVVVDPKAKPEPGSPRTSRTIETTIEVTWESKSGLGKKLGSQISFTLHVGPNGFEELESDLTILKKKITEVTAGGTVRDLTFSLGFNPGLNFDKSTAERLVTDFSVKAKASLEADLVIPKTSIKLPVEISGSVDVQGRPEWEVKFKILSW